ncbi:MAG TPA: AMP-binding protein [Candidatus Dormibacteraeota bacterium]|nr:AMP-binding protein [Candidatus Dormibacteraeota bacterium]
MLVTEIVTERATRGGARPFIRHEGRVVGYGEFERLSNQAAHAFAELGVRKGDRVTLGMGNSVEYLVAAFGALKAGAILHPINPALGASELSYILGHAEPRVILTDATGIAALTSPKLTRPAGARLAAIGAAAEVDFAALLAAASEQPIDVGLGTADGSTLLYTSGTTGPPKGVLFRHGSTGGAAQHFIDLLGIAADDTLLAVTPLFHGNAWGAATTALAAGATVAYPKAFRASEFWALVHEVHATVLYTLGTILAILLRQEPSPLERDNPLRVILGLGSAPIRDEVIRRFGVAGVAECFGSTDAGVVTMTPLDAAPRKGSAGPAVPGVTIAIVDDEGRMQPPGAPGEIVIRSPHRMAEYFRDPAQTAEALRDGWFHTGDLGTLDADGWLYFVDRKRDVIRRGGENMSSALIEKTLCEHPAVAEAAVIGVPDPVLGQEVKAFIVARAPVTPDELRAFAAERLAKFQVPRLWEFRDALPKTPTQRVEKYKLRQESGGGDKPLLG